MKKRLQFVDSHIHFWDPERHDYEWLADLPEINRPFLPAHLVEQAEGWLPEKIVFVQADCAARDAMNEVAWVETLARTEPRIQAIVAFAPLEEGTAVRPWLDRLVEYPLVKGVRRLIQSERPGFANQSDFVAGVRLLTEYDLSFDICIVHHQLEDVIDLVAECPGVRFVLDHLGKPDVRNSLRWPWQDQLTALAAFPNVCCKLSGLVTEADHDNWTKADIRPYLDHALEAFGPNRLMVGGDWPVSLLATTYREWMETVLWATADLSDGEQAKIFFHNSAEFYRLGQN